MFDNFTDQEKELHIALLRSTITNKLVNPDNLQAYSDTYDTTSSDFAIKLFLNPAFEPEEGPNYWIKKNGFILSITPTCGQYDPPIIAHGISKGEDGWDCNLWWELDEDIKHDHFQMSHEELSEQFKKCHFANLKWTGDISKDFVIWKNAALECIKMFEKHIMHQKQQLKINFNEEAS